MEWISEKFENAKRIENIVKILSHHGFGIVFDSIKTKKHIIRPEKHLREAIEDIGGGFVKLGQLLSLRPDLIPMKYCKELEKLQEDVKSVEYEEIKTTLQKSFHRPLKTVFKHISKKPIAAGSIAQVHLATLTNGKKVAIKVMKSNIKKTFHEDFNILDYLAKKLKKKLPSSINPQSIVNEFKRYTNDELDFTIEVKHAQELAKNHEGFIIPKIYDHLSSSKVIVLEYIDGIAFTKKPYKNFGMIKRKKIAHQISSYVMKQLFVDGIFHADPHPGNIFYLKNGKLALLDFGIVGTIDNKTRTSLILLLYALVSKNIDLLNKAIVRLGVKDDLENNENFKSDIKSTFGAYYSKSLDEIKINKIFSELMGLFRKYDLKIPQNMVMLSKAIATMESVCEGIYPKYNFTTEAKLFLKNNLSSMLTTKMMFYDVKKHLIDYGMGLINLPDEVKQLIDIEKKDKENTKRIEKTLANLEANLMYIELEATLAVTSLFGFIFGMLTIALGFKMYGIGLFSLICFTFATLSLILLLFVLTYRIFSLIKKK